MCARALIKYNRHKLVKQLYIIYQALVNAKNGTFSFLEQYTNTLS